MASIKVIFRQSPRKSGEGTLYYRVIHKRKMRQLHIGCRVMSDEWSGEDGKLILLGTESRRTYLHDMQQRLDEGVARLSQIIKALDGSKEDYDVGDVVDRFFDNSTVVGFVSFARSRIAELRLMGKVRISEHYATAVNSFCRFNGEGDIAFDDFNGALVARYEQSLKGRGLCPNSTSYYMRNLRALYNQAVEQGLTEQRNPFRHVYTGIAKTVKRAVKIDAIKALRRLDLSNDPLSELTRDLFLFSFYTRGMAIIDVAFLQKSNLKNGILAYRRQKTGQQLTIKWEPQMQEIVCRHVKDDSVFMFPLIDARKPDCRKQYLNVYGKINRKLKKLGKMIGLTEPLTFHRSRHGWASIARENNVPLSVICEGMGHDSERTTRIYLASLDASVVDKANSDIMRLLDK